jgi:hypothetical protein
MRKVSKVVAQAHLKISYRPKRAGILASMAPTMLQIYIGSHTGKGWLVTCARIIRPTTCANCRPQAQRNGTKIGELIMSEFLKHGSFSHATCSNTDARKGRRYNSGLTTGLPDPRRASYTFI